jgi:hypothetical protein
VGGKVKPWVWVVVGVAITGILGLIAVAGVAVYLFSQHVETRTVTPAVAARDFEQVKSRFAGQKPLIELDARGRFVRSNANRRKSADARRPEQLNVMAFDPDKGKIVRLSIPFWLLRLKMRGATIDLNHNRMDLEDLRLTVEDLERFGPTLIVDHSTADGEHVLVWSQ